MNQPETVCGEQIAQAEAAFQQAKSNAEQKHATRMTAAENALRQATEQYDRTEYEADKHPRAATDEAAAARDAAIAAAAADLRRPATDRYSAPDVRVVVAPGGSLELRSGRQRLAGAIDQGGVVWRVDRDGR